jgi:hypothetical protein
VTSEDDLPTRPSPESATGVATAGDALQTGTLSAGPVAAPARDRRGSWLPTWGLVATKNLELRRRRGLMVVVVLLTIGVPFIVLGLRLAFHAFDPKSYGPAGSPGIFQTTSDIIAEFGFIVATAVGATVGTTDLTDGVFRHLVITGRSRVALYLARIPAGLAVVVPFVVVAFAAVCLVTSYEGTAQPTHLTENGVHVPLHYGEKQLEGWLLDHPRQAQQAFTNGPVKVGPRGVVRAPSASTGSVHEMIRRRISAIYRNYTSDEVSQLNPADNEMAKVGLWILLDVAVGFLVALGFGSLVGQRTVPIVLMLVLEILLTPIFAAHVIPYFINGQRLIVGVALDQLRPAVLPSGQGGGPLGGRAGGLGIPPMPTWAMISVIVGWAVVWTGVGVGRMRTRDA